MKNQNRRNFLGNGGAVLAAGALAAIGISANAAEHQSQAGHGSHLKSLKGIDAFVIDASEEGICGTCRYWGGIRRVTENKKSVYCESLGWCNNSQSRHYQTKTTPVTGPMKFWRKWEAL